jgi:hypothetical protein
MIILLRRGLVWAALMFWQGGFLFYASVVVPVGQAQLGHTRQGFITRQVTDYLNLSAAIALLPLGWDVLSAQDPASRRRWLRGLSWFGMAVCLALLLWLHGRMDDLLDIEGHEVLDHALFRTYHRAYLWVSTVQWALALGYAGLTLLTWREEDREKKNVPSSTSSASPSHRSRQPTGQG